MARCIMPSSERLIPFPAVLRARHLETLQAIAGRRRCTAAALRMVLDHYRQQQQQESH